MSNDLKTQNTGYPTTIDIATAIADGSDEIVAQLINGPNTAIVALENALGAMPQGSLTSLASRLAVLIANDGGLLRGTTFPLSPPNIPHLFYRTDIDTLYYYSVPQASYISLATALGLTNYVRTDVATTITAQHTFAPLAVEAPFLLGANAQGQKVVGLKADTVAQNPDTAGAASGVATLDASSHVVQAGAVNPITAGAINGVCPLNASAKIDKVYGGGANSLATLNVNGRLNEDATTLFDGAGGAGRVCSNIPATNAIPVMNATKDLLDRNSNPIFASVTSRQSVQSSANNLGSGNIAVTIGDILIVQVYLSWTAGATEPESLGISMGGVGGLFLHGGLVMTQGLHAVSGELYYISMEGIVIASGTGNISFLSSLVATSPTFGTNTHKFGWAFLKKQ